ncbi:MAG: hypothetical protein ACKVZJ_13035 [Phycisphaerales bacterium]
MLGSLSTPLAAMMLIVGSGGVSSGALAQATDAAAPARDFHVDDRTWTVELEPTVWFAAFSGDVSFKDGSEIELEHVDMDEVHAAPAGRFSLRSKRWTFQFTGWATSFDDDATSEVDFDAGDFTIAAGDEVAYDLDYASFKLTAGYSFDPFVPLEDGTAAWFDLYGGFQVYHLDFELGPADTDEKIAESDTWIAPLVGARLNLMLATDFEVAVATDVGAALGPGDAGFTWDIIPHFRWFPAGNKTVAVQVGFRHNSADLNTGDDDEFQFDAFAAGLFASVVIRF